MIKADRVDFQIAPGYFLEFFNLPGNQKRIGLVGLAIACGLRRNYFSELEFKAPKHLEALKRIGFEGSTVSVTVDRTATGGKGASRSETLSLEDARKFIEFAAFDLGKKPATAIARAMMGIAIETIARQAFGEEALTLAEIRDAICKEFAKTLDWMEEDREDVRAIEEQELFLRGVRW